MRVSVCVGNYASTSYCVPGLGINVYCMEELCYVMRENAFLLDVTLMNDGLLDWIDQQCGLKELARALYPVVHKKGSLSVFVVSILNFVGLYDEQTVSEVERVLKMGAGLSGIERKKSQIDYLVKKKKYAAAIRGYDDLITKWQEQDRKEQASSGAECLAAIWHNKGVAMAGLMIYARAAECFQKAYEIEDREDYYLEYLEAKRLELPENEYVAFAADKTRQYGLTLKVEKELEQLAEEWEQQPEYLQLNHFRELRGGEQKQKYYDVCEKYTQTLKDSYRRSVSL